METNSFGRWKAGDTIALRGVWRGILWWAGPAIVVQDTSEQIALYWQAGMSNMNSSRRLRPIDLLSGEVNLVSNIWVETDVLMLVTPGEAHAVYVMWEAGQTKLRGWYINLQEPFRRTKLGFDTMDHLLDIVVSADQSAWHWKDEDEFEEAVALGVYSPMEAQAIRAEGERAIERLQNRQSPFCDGWENWTPPAQWDLPVLPEGWDKITTG
jgi:hypothetical protein